MELFSYNFFLSCHSHKLASHYHKLIMWRDRPPPPCKPTGEGRAQGLITVFPWTHRSGLHSCYMDRDPHENRRFPLNECLVDRDPCFMGALWTGSPGPTLATINLHRGVSFTTYHPPRNHWGDTSHNQRVQPLSGKEADSTPALYRPEAPALKRPKGATPLIYCEGRLPAHPTTVQI